MTIFSKDTEIARSSPAIIASYSASLLEEGKSKCMAYSITYPVGASSCSPSMAPVYREALSTFRTTSQSCLTSFPVEEPTL